MLRLPDPPVAVAAGTAESQVQSLGAPAPVQVGWTIQSLDAALDAAVPTVSPEQTLQPVHVVILESHPQALLEAVETELVDSPTSPAGAVEIEPGDSYIYEAC